jgi:hypothetical protein
MHDYDVHEAVYLNCEICISWARVLGPGAGPLLPNCENVLINLQILLYLLSNTYEEMYMYDYDVHAAVTRPFYWYLHFCPHDLDQLKFDPLLENFNIGHISMARSGMNTGQGFHISFEDFL